MRNHLWLKLTGAFGVVILIGVVVTVWLTRSGTATQFEHFMIDNQMVRPALLQRALADHFVARQSWDELAPALNGLVASASDGVMTGMMGNMMGMHDNRFQVLDAGGEVVVDSSGATLGAVLTEPPIERWPILSGDEVVGALLVEGSLMSSVAIDSSLLVRSVTRTVLLAALAAGLAALALAALFARQITQPLVRLTHASRRIAEGDLSVRVPVQSRDEVGELADTFNQMAGSLERQEMLRRHMMADVAHELRTPLTGIQGAVEAMQDGVFPADAENLEALHEEVLLLNRLVDDLRTLANAEAGQLTLSMEEIDVADLCRRQASAFQLAAAARKITLRMEAGDHLPLVIGDSQRLAQVLRNLLDNALRHTPEGGAVTLVAEPSTGDVGVQITVTDSGEGIPPAELPFIFDRFYRADHSRSRATGGSGLGLAIARQIVEAHGGHISVASPPAGSERGAVFSIFLPAHPG